MKKHLLHIGLLLGLLSCEEQIPNFDPEATNGVDVGVAAVQFSTANHVYSNIGTLVEDAIVEAQEDIATQGKVSNTENNAVSYPIFSVTPNDLTSFPKTISLDFGPDGVIGFDGVFRKGKITTISTDWYHNSGSVHATTFTNYYQDDRKIDGLYKTTNLGENEDEQLEVSIEVDNGVLTYEDGTFVTYEKNIIRRLVQGGTTPFNIWDNVYEIDGTYEGYTKDRLPFKFTIDESLKYRVISGNVYRGKAFMELDGLEDIIVNYNNYTVTYNDFTYNIGVSN